jgi:hypothetical protein
MGFEPMNTGFADQRVSHFAIGAHVYLPTLFGRKNASRHEFYCGCAVVRIYGFTVL